MSDNPFVGTWKLISCDAIRRNGGRKALYGLSPVGRLSYDAEGNMSVHLMRRNRPNFQNSTKFLATSEERNTAFEGYEAYFSTYEFSESEGIIHHSVIGGLFPNWAGTIQSRYYRFEGGNRLILSNMPFNGVRSDKTTVTLVWERLS